MTALVVASSSLHMCRCCGTHGVKLPEGVLYVFLIDVDVLHADLLPVVGGGCARQRQHHHVDGTHIILPHARRHPRLVVVPHLTHTQTQTNKTCGNAAEKLTEATIQAFFFISKLEY